MATLKEVAKLAGVSPSTASRVLSNSTFVNEDKRTRVLRAVELLNYKPNLLAKGLKEGKTKTIAYFIPDINSFYYPLLMKYIEKSVYDKGYTLILCNNSESIELEKRNLEMVVSRGVDGILAMSVTDDISHYNEVSVLTKTPILLMNRYFESDSNFVTVDNFQGGYTTTKHLLDNGHEKIAGFFGSLNIQRYYDRMQGCLKALEEYEINYHSKYFGFNINTIDDAYKKTSELLEMEDKPTAFFASVDIFTIGIYKGIKDGGYEIPNDFSVVGYDNLDITKYMTPALTTYDTVIDILAKKSVKYLIDNIESKNGQKKIKEVLKGSLIERDSVKNIN